MPSDPRNSLLEVRKAYRLLYDFQDRILDLMDFIGSSFGKTYSGGFPKYSDASPRSGQGNLDKWAWDWLNMYYYIFQFADNPKTHKGITLGVFLLADDGYFRVKKDDKNPSRRNLDSFESVGSSATRLIFVVGKDYWKTVGIFGKNWSKPEFILENSGVQNEVNGTGKMVFKSFNLADFFNQGSATARLEDFSKFCKNNGIEFELIKKEV